MKNLNWIPIDEDCDGLILWSIQLWSLFNGFKFTHAKTIIQVDSSKSFSFLPCPSAFHPSLILIFTRRKMRGKKKVSLTILTYKLSLGNYSISLAILTKLLMNFTSEIRILISLNWFLISQIFISFTNWNRRSLSFDVFVNLRICAIDYLHVFNFLII